MLDYGAMKQRVERQANDDKLAKQQKDVQKARDALGDSKSSFDTKLSSMETGFNKE